MLKSHKTILKQFFDYIFRFTKISNNLTSDIKTLEPGSFNTQVAQKLISLKYRSLNNSGNHVPSFEDTGFRVFSQNDEDGILLYIFSLIGTTNKTSVEICAGDGIQCNSANLIINHGWTGLLFDGNKKNIHRGKHFYNNCQDTFTWPPQLVHAWITAENVNQLIEQNGVSGEIDLLSLDMDGVDYWIWKTIECINPRIVILEYQDIWGPDNSVTIPYDPNFVAKYGKYGPDYCGASLLAFVKLGKEKGYRLIGVNRLGFNAFFMRNDIKNDLLPEIPISGCFNHPKVQHGIRNRLPKVKDLQWVKV